MGNVWLPRMPLVKICWYIMIASLHICISVHNDQLWLYTFRSVHIAESPTCVKISFVTPSDPGDFLFLYWLTVVWTSLSVTLSCDPMSLSEYSSFLAAVLLRFGVSFTGMLLPSS